MSSITEAWLCSGFFTKTKLEIHTEQKHYTKFTCIHRLISQSSVQSAYAISVATSSKNYLQRSRIVRLQRWVEEKENARGWMRAHQQLARIFLSFFFFRLVLLFHDVILLYLIASCTFRSVTYTYIFISTKKKSLQI